MTKKKHSTSPNLKSDLLRRKLSQTFAKHNGGLGVEGGRGTNDQSGESKRKHNYKCIREL